MSYSHDGDRRANRVEVAIYELMEAFKATGDPMFYRINPACIRWLNEALDEYGFKAVEKKGDRK